MDGVLILLGLAALTWICLGPILFFVQSSRITSLTEEVQRLRQESDKRSAAQLSRVDGLAAELRQLSEQDRIQKSHTDESTYPVTPLGVVTEGETSVPHIQTQTHPTRLPPRLERPQATVLNQAMPQEDGVRDNLLQVADQVVLEVVDTSSEPEDTATPRDTTTSLLERLANRQRAVADKPTLELDRSPSESRPRRRPNPPTAAEPKWFNEMDAMQWMSWVGAVLVMIGAGFGLKYAIEEQYLGPTGRVALGILGGVATFVGAAYAMKKDYRVLAEGLAGAAMGILYFSLFAGFQWYDLMPQPVAFGGMIVVTAVGLSFAGVFNSLPAAVLAMIGGFLTPYMLSKGGGNISTLFSYILILDLGVLALATFRSWGRLHLLNFGGTLIIWMGWLANGYRPEELWLTVAWITLFAVVFSLMGLWRHVIRKESSSTPDMALMLLTPIAYFGALYGMTKAGYSDWHGIMALLVAAYYLGLGVFAFLRNPGNNQIVVTLVGVGLSFVTLAVPLQLTGHWIVIAWAVESLLLIEIGLRYEKPGFRLTGFGLLAIVQLHMVLYAGGTLSGPQDFTTGFVRKLWEEPTTIATGKSALGGIINGRSMSFLANAIVLAILAWEYRRREKSARIEGGDETWKKLGIGGRIPDAGLISTILIPLVPVMVLAMGLLETFVFGVHARWSLSTHLSTLPIWLSLFAVATLLAFRRMADVGTLGALAKFLYGVTGCLFLVFFLLPFPDWGMVGDGLWGHVIFNPRGIGFLTALGAALVGAIQFTRSDTQDTEGRSIGSSLSVAVPLVLLGMCLTETFAFGQRHDWIWATQLSQVTVWFAAFSVGTLIAARWLENSCSLTLLSKLFSVGTMGLLLLLIATTFGDIVAHGQTMGAEAYSRVLLNPRGLCLLIGAGSLLFGVWGQATSANRDHNFVTAMKMAVPIVLLAMCLLESYAFGRGHAWIWASYVSATGICLAIFAYLTRLVGHTIDVQQSPLTGLSQVFYVSLGAVLVVLFLGTLGDWGSRVRGTIDGGWLLPIFNPRGVCFLLAIGSAWLGRMLVVKDAEVENREYLIPTHGGLSLGLFAYAAAFLMFTIEVFALGKQSHWNTGTALAITGTWALMAIATTGAGLIKRSSPIRMLAIGLFALTTAKVFLYDVWYLDKTIRWAAFIGLGVTLFATSFLYRRFREQLKDWIKPLSLLLAATLALGCGSLSHAGDAEPDLSTQFTHCFELEAFEPKLVKAEADPNFLRIAVTPEIYEASQRNLDDLRLLSVDDQGVSIQVPYLLITPADEFGQADQNLPLVKSRTLADTTEYIVGGKEIAEPVESLHLSITSPEQEYVRTVRLYGSEQTDDGGWTLLLNDGSLVDRSRGSLRLTESTIHCPPSQYRYYRIVIENEGHAPLSITHCTAHMAPRHVASRVSYPAKIENIVRTDRKTTRVEMTLPGPVPIDRLEIKVTGADEYHRNAQLLSIQETSATPISSVQLFHLAHFSKGHKASITFSTHITRKLRLEIQNGDDQPINVISAQASGIERSLVVPIKSWAARPNPVALYVGGKISAPSYDLAHISTVPDLDNITPISVLSGKQNASYHEINPSRPWAEEHTTLVWIIVLAGVLGLSAVAVTLLKAVSAQEILTAGQNTTPSE